MKSLYQYISNEISNPPQLDGHLHVFDSEGVLNRAPLTSYAVGFMDFDLKNPPKDIIGLYKKNMKKCPWVKYWLLTGPDYESIESAFKELNCFSGFGELKLYDRLGDEMVGKKDISLLRKVVKLSESAGNLPVYVHYSLEEDRDAKALKKVLETYPNTPVVLCHCGMNSRVHEGAWERLLGLLENHKNLWVDLSWEASRWLLQRPILISQLPGDRVFWGSDDSPYRQRKRDPEYADKHIQDSITLTKYINNDFNIKKLFKTI